MWKVPYPTYPIKLKILIYTIWCIALLGHCSVLSHTQRKRANLMLIISLLLLQEEYKFLHRLAAEYLSQQST